jgi:hypothetical protein
VGKKVIAPLSAEAQAELATWLAQHDRELPAPVRIALEQHAALREALRGSQRELASLVRQLRRAMGIAPGSEKRTSKDPVGPTSGGDGQRPKSVREKLRLKLERSQRLTKWHRDIARRHGSDMMRTEKKLSGLPDDAGEVEACEDAARSAEEEAELEQEHRQHLARCELGDGPDQALQSVSEALLSGAEVTTSEEIVRLPAPEPAADEVVIDTLTEERVRYDFTLVVGRVVAEVEKKVVVGPNGRRRMLSASTATLGPPRLGVTWRFLVNTAVMVVQYAMPMNRLAHLLSTDDKRFTAASLARLLRYVAERFAPIYLHLFDELADAEILMGDDTSPRVLEVRRHFAAPAPVKPPPWASYRDRDVAETTLAREGQRLEAQLARELGFESARRSGDGPKRSLNTTVVAGRSDPTDPQSLIVFYRSHLGGFGNLLEMLLERREPSAGGVTVQSDLATVNLVHDPALRERFPIQQVGCASHARRPFALHEAEDEQLCEIMLHHFKGLFIHEQLLDAYGRNRENVAAVRDVDDRAIWAEIKRLAKLMTRKWSRETKLGEAARYILRHFDELTAYLDDPRLDPTNNFSERMLRLEKLIEASSMFRATLGGRFVLDIIRTVLQTSIAARAPLQEYVLSVLQTDPDQVAAAPECFTPHAWVRKHLEVGPIADLDAIADVDLGLDCPVGVEGECDVESDVQADAERDLEDHLEDDVDIEVERDLDEHLDEVADCDGDLDIDDDVDLEVDLDIDDDIDDDIDLDVDLDVDDEVKRDLEVNLDEVADCDTDRGLDRTSASSRRRSHKRRRSKRRRR